MDFFGETNNVELEPILKVIWPSRAVNSIEGELLGELADALAVVEQRASLLFIEDDEWKNANDYSLLYGPVTAREAMMIQDIIRGDVILRYRRQLIVARECGARTTTEQYLVACLAEGIAPLVRKDSK